MNTPPHLNSPEEYRLFYEKDAESFTPRRLHKLDQKRFKWLINKLTYRETVLEKKVDPIVDLGCQDGSFTIALSLFGWDVVGVEISSKLVDVCKQNLSNIEVENCGPIEFVCDTAEEYLRFASGLETIVCFELLEHVFDPVVLLQRCYLSLNWWGKIYICVPQGSSWDWDTGHVRRFTVDSLLGLMDRQHFATCEPLTISYDTKCSWLFVEGQKIK